MNFPIIMHGTTLIFEVGEDLEEDVAANYARNLDKVFAELPAPVISGTTLTVEDLQQELICNINIKHREEFDEEKEPDGMVLSGWVARADRDADVASKDERSSAAPSATTSGRNTMEDEEFAAAKPGTKRKTSERTGKVGNGEDNETLLGSNGETHSKKPQEVADDDDDIIMLDEYPETSKKKRLH